MEVILWRSKKQKLINLPQSYIVRIKEFCQSCYLVNSFFLIADIILILCFQFELEVASLFEFNPTLFLSYACTAVYCCEI